MAGPTEIDGDEIEDAHDGMQPRLPARVQNQANRVTRFTFFRRTLLLNFYPVLTVAAGNIILLGVPQAREALGAFRSFGDVGADPQSLWANPSYWIFIAALAYWSLTAWYCARLLLAKRFAVDNVGQCAHHRFAAATNAWLPRALGLLSCVPITAWFALPGAPPGAWLAPALYTGAFLVLVVLRRRLVNRWLGRQSLPARAWARGRGTAGISVMAVLLMFAVSALVLAAVVFGQEAASRAAGRRWPCCPCSRRCWPRSRTKTTSSPTTAGRPSPSPGRRWPTTSAPGRRRAALMPMNRSTWWRPPAAPRARRSGPARCCWNWSARRAARASASRPTSTR
jgi:hypothetical protein